MSALPPKADMCDATRDVRYGPIADIILLDHFVRPGKYCRRNCETKCLRGLEIDHKLVLGRLLNWKIGRFFALKDAINVSGRFAVLIKNIRPIRDQATVCDEKAIGID